MNRQPWVVVRARDDMPLINDTLAMLARQDLPHRVLVMDNASRDGSRQCAADWGAQIIDIPAGAYVPGRVLNLAMEHTDGEVVAFLNSDCTPLHIDWLRRLLDGFATPAVAAVFGRQEPRPDCHPLYARDTEATYGDGAHQHRWRHCFSMAASAIRRDVWQRMRFDERLRYSEDMDWTWRARQMDHDIRYVPEARAMHSHNYTINEYVRRQYGEACAEARIFSWSPWQRSMIRYAVLPWLRQVAADVRHCVRVGRLDAAVVSPLIRLLGQSGRWRGLRDGLRARQREEECAHALRPERQS